MATVSGSCTCCLDGLHYQQVHWAERRELDWDYETCHFAPPETVTHEQVEDYLWRADITALIDPEGLRSTTT